ncbi:hypothetical protein ACFFF5_04925 [Lederbergia wuyishanensis]|uniref:DUF4129 domain-containing protein n=1 Tax=Lederbergia wuyishanensis TaxID=1347903 RepID=A0ABU0CZ69_9BACI|nr:hypothetical protein [Lederbergia wuyishanensis]MCJ8006073.1 hypothetical protein [Lederbergia wuyishanensis]MDQ0341442.1 hypothetical protein [Lederbergia wuyishanensis]
METKEFSSMMNLGHSQWGIIRSFLLKAVFVSLIVSPVHLKESIFITVAWPFLLLVIIGCAIVMSFQFINAKGFMFNFLLFTVPTILLLSIFFRLPFWLFLFSVFFLFFVLKKEMENYSYDFIDGGESLLVLTVVISIVIWFIAAIFSLPFLYPVLLLVLLQFIVFSFGTFIKRYRESGAGNNKKSLFFKFSSGVIGILAIGFSTAYLLATYLRKLFDQLLSLFANTLTFISERVFPTKPILNQELEQKQLILPGGETGVLDVENVLNLQSSKVLNVIVMFIIFIIVCLVALYVYKNVKNYKRQSIDSYSPSNGFFSYISPFIERKGINPRYSDVDNEIRKAIRSLEKYANKRDLGRYSNESLREWISRIGVSMSKESVTIYESVRYGSVQATTMEINLFLKDMNTVKGKLGEISKKMKE